MPPRRRIISIVLAVLGLLLLTGIAAVKLMFSDEHLAAFARDRVRTSLGRELTLDELSLQFRPLPTVVFKNAALGNAPWAKETYLLHADHATARLDLASLLRGRLEVASLSIEGLTANLEISSDSRKNWQMHDHPIGRKNGNALLAPLHLASLQIKNARIHYAKYGEPIRNWQLDEVIADADHNWRNVKLDAKLLQNDISLLAKARFADLSKLGQEGAVSDGDVELSLGTARLMASGTLPISGSFQKHKLKLDFSAQSAREMLAFFGISDLGLAPLKLSVNLQDNEGAIQASDLRFQIGRLNVSGEAKIDVSSKKPHYRANLASEDLDWAQTLRDFGRPTLPPKPPGQLFRDTPLGWRAIAALQKIPGKTELSIRRVTLRSGIELTDFKANIAADEKQWRVDKFSFAMLDGIAKGVLTLDGHRKTAKLDLETSKVSLGKWLAARGHKLALNGGPTDLKASLTAAGLSMRDLAESLNGQIRISVGPAKLYSRQMQQAETWLIGLAPMFSTTEANYVNVACVSAYLPFEKGRAAAEPLVGIRSDASQLLASGYVDLKEQVLDLRGRVRARSGVSLGVSNIAGGNLKIAGRIDKPSIGLDPESTPGALARIGAAIMTSGVSLIATAIWDAANPASDPCQITFSAHDARRVSHPTKVSASDTAVQEN